MSIYTNPNSSFSAAERAAWIADHEESEQLLIFSSLPEPLAEETFEALPVFLQKRLIEQLPKKEGAHLLTILTPDDRTALLQDCSSRVLEELLKRLPLDKRKEAVALLRYPEGSVGRLMTPDYLSALPEWTVEKTLDEVRLYQGNTETLDMIYIVDASNKLLDDLLLKDLLFVDRNKKLADLADNQYVSLLVDQPDESAISIFQQTNRNALPVISHDGVLLGIVTIDDILRLSDQAATEDIQKIGGTEALSEPYLEAPFLELMRKRAGWLVLLFLGEMLTATALAFFEQEISKAVVLALFLPLIISSGGNAGSQASTLIIRAIALGEISSQNWRRVVRREIFSGIVLGAILGLVGFFRVVVWGATTNIYGEHWLLLAIAIFCSLIGVVSWGTLSGACLPMILKKMRLDPATSSAPFVATLVDVVGVIIYFFVAIHILKGTLL